VPVHMHAVPWTLRTCNLGFVPHAAHSNNSLASPQTASCLPLSSTNPFPYYNPPSFKFDDMCHQHLPVLPQLPALHPQSQTRSIPCDLSAHALPTGPAALSEVEEGPWPAWRPARRQGAPWHNPLIHSHDIAAPASSHARMITHRPVTRNNPLAVTMGLCTQSPESQFLMPTLISTPRRGRAASSRRLRSLTA
jgi:hypothetical protein